MGMVVDRQTAAQVLNTLRAGAAIWFVKPFRCVLNRSAVKMTGFSESEFTKNQSLWLMRVHPLDMALVNSARRKLRTQMREIVCDYRFLPNGRSREIWLRDVSVPVENSKGGYGGIFSVYSEIPSSTKAIKPSVSSGMDFKKVVGGLAHNIRTSLHELSGNIELFGVESGVPAKLRKAADKTMQINDLIGEFEEYFCPPDTRMARGNALLLLKDLLRDMQEKVFARGIELSVAHQDCLPHVEIDPSQMRQAIDRLLSFSVSILPEGGRLSIKTRLCSRQGSQYVEVELACYSPDSLIVGEENIFEPFLQVGRYKTGLSLALAREALYRNFGRVSFRKKDPHEARFTLLLKVFSG
jgi:nitrogen-specific signal transduction histidine kinase